MAEQGLEGLLSAGGHGKVMMEGSSQGREEADKRLSLTMLPVFPSTNPRSILCLFTPLTQIRPRRAGLGLCSLPEADFHGSPRPHLPITSLSSPHHLPTTGAGIPHCRASPLVGFRVPGRRENLQRPPSTLAVLHEQLFHPQDTLGI